MRRMYSEQELTRIIGEVFDQKLESGALDSSISDAVDAYLVEHPVDITALVGKDVSCKSVTTTNDITAGGSITGPSIIQTMSGFSYSPSENTDVSISYAGVVQNGNKLTFALAGKYTPTELGATIVIGGFFIPESIYNKLVNTTIGVDSVLGADNLIMSDSVFTNSSIPMRTTKTTSGGYQIFWFADSRTLTLNTEYAFRIEETFLLSDNLAQ